MFSIRNDSKKKKLNHHKNSNNKWSIIHQDLYASAGDSLLISIYYFVLFWFWFHFGLTIHYAVTFVFFLPQKSWIIHIGTQWITVNDKKCVYNNDTIIVLCYKAFTAATPSHYFNIFIHQCLCLYKHRYNVSYIELEIQWIPFDLYDAFFCCIFFFFTKK